MAEESKMKEALINVGSVAAGICGGIVVKKTLQTLPVNLEGVHPLVVKIGEYGLYSLACIGVQNAVKRDILSWLSIVDSAKVIVESVKELREAEKEEEDDDSEDSGQQLAGTITE